MDHRYTVVEPTQRPNPVGQINTIRIWLKAFIPNELEGVEHVPDNGEHAGKLMLASPHPFKAWFLTDQRRFSSEIDASARMHSQIDIDVQSGSLIDEQHRCGDSIEVNAEDGIEKCRKTATSDQMKFSNFTVTDAGRKITVELEGSAKNPCMEIAGITVSPNLDYKGVITIMLDEARQCASVCFAGHIETYPAFEMYVSANGGPARTLFQHSALPGCSPVNLVGGPQREIHHGIILT
jgi:hypothetical protein